MCQLLRGITITIMFNFALMIAGREAMKEESKVMPDERNCLKHKATRNDRERLSYAQNLCTRNGETLEIKRKLNLFNKSELAEYSKHAIAIFH